MRTPTGYPEPREARTAPPWGPIGAGLDPAAGELYTGTTSLIPEAGLAAMIQLLNPNESQARAIVESIHVNVATPTNITIRRRATALTTRAGNWLGGGRSGYPGVAQVRTQSAVSSTGNVILRLALPASTLQRLDPLRIILDPGESIVVAPEDADIRMDVTFLGREWPH